MLFPDSTSTRAKILRVVRFSRLSNGEIERLNLCAHRLTAESPNPVISTVWLNDID